MRVLIATDAWHPQVNGVVRTLTSLAASARTLGVAVDFLTPEGFPSFALPTYSNLRLALPNRREIARRIQAAAPDAIHIATEGTIGAAARAYCLRRGLPFTSSYTTRFPEYISARVPIPESWSYAVLRHFHSAATVTMVSTVSLMSELRRRGFRNLGMWTRGVDTDLFAPHRAIPQDLPRPIFLTAGRSRGREKSRSVPVAGPARLQGRDRGRTAGSRAQAPLPASDIPRIAERAGTRGPDGVGGRVRLSRVSPIRSASCSSRRWPAACRSRPFR